MARYSRRSSGARRRSTGRTYSRRATGARRYARSSGAGNRSRGSSRGGVVKLIIQQAPAQQAPAGYTPGVPGMVGVAALGPAKKSAF